MKIPSGRIDVEGRFWRADGTSIPFPAAQAIQPGDGGWGVILSAKGFRPAGDRMYVYGGGSYTFSTRTKSDVLRTPGTSSFWGVPDTWEATSGLSFLLATRWASVPLRAYMDFQPSFAEESAGRSGGGLSRSIILTTYAVRF